MADDWVGTERRGIPIHLLNFMNEQVDAHTNKVETLLKDHIRDESGQFDEFLKMLQENNEASEKRHNELVQQLNAITSSQKLMDKAFVTDEDGEPDYRGHANSHRSWIRKADDEDKVMAYVRQQMQTDIKRQEDIRFALRAVIIVVVGAIVMWAGKELMKDAIEASHQPAYMLTK